MFASQRKRRNLDAGEMQLFARRVLIREHHLEERRVRQLRSGFRALHQQLERKILVVKGS